MSVDEPENDGGGVLRGGTWRSRGWQNGFVYEVISVLFRREACRRSVGGMWEAGGRGAGGVVRVGGEAGWGRPAATAARSRRAPGSGTSRGSGEGVGWVGCGGRGCWGRLDGCGGFTGWGHEAAEGEGEGAAGTMPTGAASHTARGSSGEGALPPWGRRGGCPGGEVPAGGYRARGRGVLR